jgi:hypothetical protein
MNQGMNMTVFWDTAPYSLVEIDGATSQKTAIFINSKGFWRRWLYLRLLGFWTSEHRTVDKVLKPSNPSDLHSHRRENIKSHMSQDSSVGKVIGWMTRVWFTAGVRFISNKPHHLDQFSCPRSLLFSGYARCSLLLNKVVATSVSRLACSGAEG